MTLAELKKEMAGLKLSQLQRLEKWLSDRISLLEKKDENKKTIKSRREVLGEERRGSWLYQQVAVKCGKEGCKCNEGKPHGTYWYAYRREGKKVVSKYIGKVFREVDE